jgi:hypothetical protein
MYMFFSALYITLWLLIDPVHKLICYGRRCIWIQWRIRIRIRSETSDPDPIRNFWSGSDPKILIRIRSENSDPDPIRYFWSGSDPKLMIQIRSDTFDPDLKFRIRTFVDPDPDPCEALLVFKRRFYIWPCAKGDRLNVRSCISSCQHCSVRPCT